MWTLGLPEVQLLQAGIGQVVVGPLVDVPLGLDLVVVRQAVHLVDEHLEVDVRVDLVGPGHRQVKPAQRLDVVILQRDFVLPIHNSILYIISQLLLLLTLPQLVAVGPSCINNNDDNQCSF